MKKIYIIKEEKAFNYNGLYKFGDEIIPIRKYDVRKDIRDSTKDKAGMEMVLAYFDYEHDYIMLSGCPITSFAVGAILGDRFPYVNTLCWDNRNRLYVPGRWHF